MDNRLRFGWRFLAAGRNGTIRRLLVDAVFVA